MSDDSGLPREGTFLERVGEDIGGALTVGMAYIGLRLGLFAAVAEVAPATSELLAAKTGLNERYVREWAKAMVASRYLEYDPSPRTYFLTVEQEEALLREESRTYVAGAFQMALPSLLLTPRLMDLFRTGGGLAFSELPAEIPDSIERMHRPWFDHLLVQEWLPGAAGLVDVLRQGMAVLDVGCGQGRSTLAMARAYPKSSFLGVDPHAPSIDKARARTVELGVHNAQFLATTVEALQPQRAHQALLGAGTATWAGAGAAAFDLIVAIDCIHDMAAPVAALQAIRRLLSEHGIVFWSEPTGSNEPLENRNPQGKIRANLSPFHCLTVSLAEGGAGLGTIIGEVGARELARQAAFSHFEKLSIQSAAQQFFLLRAGGLATSSAELLP